MGFDRNTARAEYGIVLLVEYYQHNVIACSEAVGNALQTHGKAKEDRLLYRRNDPASRWDELLDPLRFDGADRARRTLGILESLLAMAGGSGAIGRGNTP